MKVDINFIPNNLKSIAPLLLNCEEHGSLFYFPVWKNYFFEEFVDKLSFFIQFKSK